MSTEPSYIKLDSRGRVSIGRYSGESTWYVVSVDQDGVVTLKPTQVPE